ncbi:hypothetical protein B0T10DRAFT_464381 [Thelonectria olida]|uniref:DUF5597 domain-containing protein n=1 Tax=Thelonectria olida TaxID=1576542 RepID=A0A9P9AHA3_9HYPO|nr:hypothetical protein B0T10DRAFT_464381 [Thelonectria olida]
MWLAHGTYGALGASPFGIDTGSDAVGREYKLLSQVKKLIVNAPNTERFGRFFDEAGRLQVLARWIRIEASFKSVKKGVSFTGILSAKEMEGSQEGNLRVLRLFNGDETRGGQAMLMPNEAPDYGDFPIPVSIPARTGIAEVEVYTLGEDA